MRVKDIRLSNTHGLNSRARAMGGTATTAARAGTVAEDIRAMEDIRDTEDIRGIRGIRDIKDIMGMEDGTNSGSPGRSHNGAGVPTTTA